MTSKRARRRRENAFREQGGLCWYCKRPMVIVTLPVGVTPPRNACTLEHLRPRGDPARVGGDSAHRNVAACYECNNRLGCEHGDKMNAYNPRQSFKLVELIPSWWRWLRTE